MRGRIAVFEQHLLALEPAACADLVVNDSRFGFTLAILPILTGTYVVPVCSSWNRDELIARSLLPRHGRTVVARL
jgi:hypothetical protein